MGPCNQRGVGLKVNGQRVGTRVDHMEFVNGSAFEKTASQLGGRSFWKTSKRCLLWCLRADMKNGEMWKDVPNVLCKKRAQDSVR